MLWCAVASLGCWDETDPCSGALSLRLSGRAASRARLQWRAQVEGCVRARAAAARGVPGRARAARGWQRLISARGARVVRTPITAPTSEARKWRRSQRPRRSGARLWRWWAPEAVGVAPKAVRVAPKAASRAIEAAPQAPPRAL
ncbi:hypothetical protein FOA52_013104 [Chlamydomonas sp. UWO 241]|nr:hypothetical protein FOA52_013104 [Chlamydomonas sp. UWO 241]